MTAASGQLATAGAAAIPGGITLAEAADVFLSSPGAASPNVDFHAGG